MSDRPGSRRGPRLRRLPAKIGYGYGPWLMSNLRKLWVLLRHPHCDVRFGKGCYLGPGFSLHMPESATFVAGDGVEFRRNFRAELARDAVVEIGGGARFTYDVLIQCGERIEIGERVLVAGFAVLVDGSHRFRDPERPILAQGYDLRPVEVGDDAALMTKATVVGAKIGERTFVGANSVVASDLPPYSLAVGAPARVIDSWDPGQSD